jgi:hypothetical protein
MVVIRILRDRCRLTLTPLARVARDRYLLERELPVSRAHWNPTTPLIGSLDDIDAGIKPLRLWEVMHRFFRLAAQIIENAPRRWPKSCIGPRRTG